MRYPKFIIRLAALLTAGFPISSVCAQNQSPFSFDEIAAVLASHPLPEVESLLMPDGVVLAYRHYAASRRAQGIVILYHGAGLHSGAGY